ncbi:MAG: 50S ribosomal protein L19e [Candidatus Micrarchaeota archaeon]|nr:50S ribosomal protein L19e [Candidatus Micrarchaeota archaeon]
MSVATVRRLCARIFDVGESRVKILDAKRASEALSAEDVRELVKEKVVVIIASKGPSRKAARHKQSRIRAGRRRGEGSKKGTSISQKTLWIRKIRSQRKLLRSLKSTLTAKGAFRKVYKMVKGNAFKNKHALSTYLKENKLLTETGAK